MGEEITYSDTGVDRNQRAEAKSNLNFEGTHKYIGNIIKLPFSTVYERTPGRYQDHVIEGIGTKVLISQLANKFDTIGIDAVAVAVNDIIRSGAEPISLVDNIDIQRSEPKIIGEITKGIIEGANKAEIAITGGEIADVKEMIAGVSDNPFHIVCSCIGNMLESNIIWGNKLEAGDAVIGLRSSGLHSNGISLARKILFKKWGGKFDPFDIPEGFDKEIVLEALEPTNIYVKPFLEIVREFEVKAAMHVTGDAYLKFDKLIGFNPKIGFEFSNFKPQPIFQLIQDSADNLGKTLTDEEMLKTFNLGWGFAIVTKNDDADSIIQSLSKNNVEADIIGSVTDSKSITAKYNGKEVILKR